MLDLSTTGSGIIPNLVLLQTDRVMIDTRRPLLFAAAIVLLVVSGLLGGAYALADIPGVEKVATALALPLGIVWLTLIGVWAGLFWSRQYGWMSVLFVPLLLLTALGNGYVAASLAGRLEASYSAAIPTALTNHVDQPPREDPLLRDEPAVASVDVVVVLGGGVGQYADGTAGGNRNADRLLMAARLYHAGLTPRLHCTGEQPDSLRTLERTEGQLAREVLVSLGVPPDAVTVGGGRNTSEEFTGLAETFPNERIGVVTSAWHLKRAERLAAAAGVDVVPFPCDFLAAGPSPHGVKALLAFVPQSAALDTATRSIREFYAEAVSR